MEKKVKRILIVILSIIFLIIKIPFTIIYYIIYVLVDLPYYILIYLIDEETLYRIK